MYLPKKSLPLIGLLCLLLSCAKVQEPQFRRLDHFGVKKLGIKETTIGFNVTYFNPNNFGLSVKEAAFDVYVDSTYVGKFLQPQSVAIEKQSDFSIPLEGTITLKDALALNLPRLYGKEVFIQANGSAKVGKGGIFVTKAINYSGRHKLSSDLIKNPAEAGLQ